MVYKEMLIHYGAQYAYYVKEDFIMEEGMLSEHFFYICNGQVKLNKLDELNEDKEYIYDIYSNGQFFGEAAIFLNTKCLCNAIAITDVRVLMLEKKDFLEMLEDNFFASSKIHYGLSKKLFYQWTMLPILSSQDAENRIMALLTYFKENDHCVTTKNKEHEVSLTRQQIGDMTGLRVETVIRTIKRLKFRNKIQVIKGKIIL